MCHCVLCYMYIMSVLNLFIACASSDAMNAVGQVVPHCPGSMVTRFGVLRFATCICFASP